MVDSALAARATPRATAAVAASSRRARAPPLAKQLQALLGPRVATLRNLSLCVIIAEGLVIVFLALAITAKNNALARLAGTSDVRRIAAGYEVQTDTQYGLAPIENGRVVQAALDEADYDDMSPAITGISSPKKFTTFLGHFTRCKPRPCNIDHWAYIGEKCFYRDDHVKDRVGHNSTVWSLIDAQEWYYTLENDFACPAVICRHQWREELNLTEHIVLRVLQEHYQNATPWNLENMFLGNKYARINQFWGLEYKLNGGFTLTRTDDSGNETQENKTATITIRRGFTQKYCDVSVNADVPEPDEPIYVVVPYTGRVEMLRLFYENIKELLDQGVSLRVILATHGGPVHLLGAAELLREMQLGFSEGELTDGHIVQVVEASSDRFGNFSRSKALMDGARYVPAEGLMFYCDVDMIVKKGFFDNCRYNTQRNYQIYYPVVYSLYPYGYKVSKEHGYWRNGAFGMVCGYKSDFKRTKTWDRASRALTGWGFEDVLLHKEFTNHWQISVFHALEPNLLHRWHPKYCEFNQHVAACLGTVFQNMGSQKFLASLIAANGIDVRKVPYDPSPVIFAPYKNDTAGSKERTLEMPAAESETDLTKLEEFKKIYEEAVANGKGGLLSVFAKEAQETVLRANSQQVAQSQAHAQAANPMSNSPQNEMANPQLSGTTSAPPTGSTQVHNHAQEGDEPTAPVAPEAPKS